MEEPPTVSGPRAVLLCRLGRRSAPSPWIDEKLGGGMHHSTAPAGCEARKSSPDLRAGVKWSLPPFPASIEPEDPARGVR